MSCLIRAPGARLGVLPVSHPRHRGTATVRQIALTIVPSLHGYEMIRAGLFGNRIQTYYDIAYLTWILAIVTLLGLWVMRDVRKHLVLE